MGEDIYDCVPCEDDGDDIYEDIIKVEVQQPMVSLPAPPHRLHADPTAEPLRGALGAPSSMKCSWETGRCHPTAPGTLPWNSPPEGVQDPESLLPGEPGAKTRR